MATPFTGKERDGETGLDYFGARYYSGAQGRFTSPDKPFADQHIENPQSWNLYSYSLNNPLRYVDPNGEGVVEGAAKWVDRTGLAFISLVLEPEKTIPAIAGNIYNAATHPGDTLSAIGTGLQNFANASLDDKVTTLTEVGLDIGTAALTGGASRGSSLTTIGTIEWTTTQAVKAGSFSITDWTGYPAGVPKPPAGSTFRLVEGAEYQGARNAANQANTAIRQADPSGLAGKEIHEITPVKFGGSPTNPANKVALPTNVHRQQVTPWWNRLKKDLEGSASQ